VEAIYPSENAFGQHHFDMANGFGGIQPFGTSLGAVHDGVAAEQFVRIFQIVETFTGGLITAVGQKSPRLQQRGGPQELIGIPPE
jgi:hypothetical protein